MSGESKRSEFGLIAELLAPLANNAAALGLADDAALVDVPDGQQLVISTDMLVVGVHVPQNTNPQLLANRLVACNISDLAAKGALPFGCQLSLGVSEQWDSAFIEAFVSAFGRALKRYDLTLWGGDTVASTEGFAGLTVHGLVPQGTMLTRSGACDGDDVYVTGTIGDAFLDLEGRGPAYADPQPPLAFGQKLRDLAHAAIDVSDGLMADLDHLCAASGGAMDIAAHLIPLSEAGHAHEDITALVSGGDDLQIAFTAPPENKDDIAALAAQEKVRVTPIGRFSKRHRDAHKADFQAVLMDDNGQAMPLRRRGYWHF